MPSNADQLATDLLNAAHNAGGTLTVTFDIGNWPEEMVRETVDYVLAGREKFKLRLRGVRTDGAGFAKFGIEMDTSNSGLYQGVPVVRAEVPFDTMELVFAPQRQ
jgi:hypothetical protein